MALITSKFSELVAGARTLIATDVVMVSEVDVASPTGYSTVSLTGQNIIDAGAAGSNIGSSDLTISSLVRTLTMSGALVGNQFNVRNSAGTRDILRVDGTGVVTFNEAFSFPSTDGTPSQILETDGAGTLTWATAGGGGGSNIGSSDLTISATGTRKLTMAGAATTDLFNLRNSADSRNIFSFAGEGTMAIGYASSNTGANSEKNVVIGTEATNGGFSHSVAVGYQAEATANVGTALGYLAKAGLNSTALGYNANASLGQYNISIGESASCSNYSCVAIGRLATAYWSGIAIGQQAATTGGGCVSIGHTSAAYYYSVALGYAAAVSSPAQYGIAIGTLAKATAVRSGMISLSGAARTNAQQDSLAVNFNLTDHTWRIAATADQWNNGTGSFGFGTITPDASAVIDLSSTTKGILLPRMTTAERDAISTPTESLIMYDADLHRHHTFDGANWKPIGSLFGFYAQTVVSSTITNTTTETTIVGAGVGALTVPADTFLVGDSYHAKIGGLISAQNGDDITVNIKTGATVLATTGLISLEAVTALGWELELDFTIASIGAGGSICTNGNFAYNRNTGSLEGFVFQDVQTIDTTAANTLDITIQWNQAKIADEIYSANFVLHKTF